MLAARGYNPLPASSGKLALQAARELRPAVLDDLGLIPALHSFLKSFEKETGIRVSLTAFAGLEDLSNAKHRALPSRAGSADQCRPPRAGHRLELMRDTPSTRPSSTPISAYARNVPRSLPASSPWSPAGRRPRSQNRRPCRRRTRRTSFRTRTCRRPAGKSPRSSSRPPD